MATLPSSSMKFIQHKYETFKEFPSEERPVQQNILSTIEFGFSPFVPFSKDFGVYVGSLGSGFGVHPESGPPQTPDWGRRIGEYERAKSPRVRGMGMETGMEGGGGAPQVLMDNVVNAPQGEMKRRADEMSRKITLMLEQEGIAKAEKSPVREEIEGRAVALMLMNTMTEDQWKNPEVDEQVNLAAGQLLKAGGETFDLWADTEDNRKVLEYNLHMLARQLGPTGPAFVKGVRAMETTTEFAKKRFQVLMDKSGKTAEEILDNFENSVQLGIEQLLTTYFSVKGTTMAAAYTAIGEQKDEGPESLEYFARQMLSRFMGIESGGLGIGATGYIFRAPVSKYYEGVAVIRAHVNEDGSLKKPYITANVGIIGGESFARLMEAGHADDIRAFELYTRQTFASNAQLALWDYQQMSQHNDASIFAMAAVTYQPVVNRMALSGDSGLTIGSALGIEMEQTLGNVVQSSGRVQAVEVIGSTEATAIVKEQVEAFFLSSQIESSFERFYKESMAQSAAVTNTWRNSVKAGGYTVDANRGGIYARDGGPYVGNEGDALEGVGIPFWFLIGRDPTGFEKFRNQYSHSAVKFSAAARKKPTKAHPEGEYIPIAKRGVTMKGVAHGFKDRRMKVRNPNEHWITKTWRPASVKKFYKGAIEQKALHDDYMELDWRKGLGDFGSAGVMQEDMTALRSEVEAILSKSRVGGVQQNSSA
tara:strand:+ start:185 stop:2296 length:2112 start_codon:yes stop_codon:yes gene_type:complete